MGWMNSLEDSIGNFNRKVDELRAFGAPPRDLTEQDASSWYEKAATARPPKSRAEMIASISAANPVRYARLRREYKWLQKMARRRGLSVEDARWLL